MPLAVPDALTAGTVVAVFLLSGVSLMWEVGLTRLASATLSYHYAFVVVSLAVGGLGLGGVLVHLTPRGNALRVAAWSAAAAGVLFVIAAFLIPPLASNGTLGGLIWLSLPPFVAVGGTLTSAFRATPQSSPVLYGADLVGAGIGAVASIAGLNLLGPFSLIFVLGAASAVSALLLARDAYAGGSPEPRLRLGGRPALPALAICLLCVSMGGIVLQMVWTPLDVNYRTMTGAPPDKTIVSVLRDRSNGAHIIDTRWDAFARTDVVRTVDASQRLIFTDGGAGTYMQRWDGRLASQAALQNDLETVPFLLGPHWNVLIIGSGGGIDVLRALEAGAGHVTAVDWNRDAVAAVRAERGYNGNILDRPNVTTVIDDGRHFLARSSEKYDTILLNLVFTGASQGASNALAESYIFTTEAFRTYLSHLTGRGRIGIISHQALEGLRSFTTGVEAFHQRGYSYAEALQRGALLMTNNQTPQSRPTLTVLQSYPFNRRELTYLRSRGNGDLNLQPLYVPLFYRGAFRSLATGNQTLADFLQGSDYNVGPTTDNRPFFFDLSFGLPEGLAAALRYAIMLTLGVLALALLLRFRRRAGAPVSEVRTSPVAGSLLTLYMALLGIGFMCVEIPLIQRFISILGEPTLAVSVVLGSLLVAGGVGSLVAGRLPSRRVSLTVIPLAVAVLAVLAQLVLPTLQASLLTLPRAGAIGVSILTLIPIGLALGMPFPLALRLSTGILPDSIALFWSINAAFSVLGSVLAALVAVQLGFDIALLIGAACYGVGALALYVIADTAARSEAAVARPSPSALARSHT